MEGMIQKVAELIRQAKKVIVFAGAGVSTESGISDHVKHWPGSPGR